MAKLTGVPADGKVQGFLGIVPREVILAILRRCADEAGEQLERLEAQAPTGRRSLPMVLLAKGGMRMALGSYADGGPT